MSSVTLNPVRVLYYSGYVSPESGASHALRQTVRRVQANGIQVTLAVPDTAASREMFPADEFAVAYIRIQRPRRSPNPLVQARYLLSLPLTLLALDRLVREKQPAIVHFNEITDFIAGAVARWRGVPALCHVRAECPSNPYRWLLLFALRRLAQMIVVPSRFTGSWIRNADPGLGQRLRLIYDYAFDASQYRPSSPGSELRKQLGIPEDAALVVMVSKLVPLKGHECFIRAAERVMAATGKVRFVLVGGPVPGHEAEAAEIEALAARLTPPPGLLLLGHRSDLPQIYAACDIAVHCPVYPDPYPTVVLLPMLAGKPVIGSNIGGIPEQIAHEQTGLLVAPDDPAALAASILQLALNPARRKQLGSAAEEAIREAYRPENQGRQLAELYQEIRGRETIAEKLAPEPRPAGPDTVLSRRPS